MITIDNRFDSQVDRNGPIPASAPHLGRCWLFIGASGKQDGFGRFKWLGKSIRANRFSLERKLGRPLGEKMLASPNESQATIAASFNISQKTVSDIVRGATWKHVPLEQAHPQPIAETE